ncbi:LysR family transcriptional regulator [Desulfovibrio aminophilus]|uniref:LysR family transcriptional regulator n=1 Tax=Desulfovibrio aminophilus TaxID=81425 RepID=UPI00041B8944|nr:LysR family transcriptional regulator [Desulfovibrio aminophilus]
MDIRQLRTFLEAARRASFKRAAQAVHLAQSSVSAQLRALEEELGSPLFERRPRRVTLTATGEALLPYAERIVALAEEALAALSPAAEPRGKLTICSSESLAGHRLPEILRRYRLRHPQVRLVLKPASYEEIKTYLDEDRADLAFVIGGPVREERFQSETLLLEHMVLALPPGHRLAGRAALRARDLNDETIIFTGPRCSYRLAFERSLAACGNQPASWMEFSNVEAIKRCVASGLGVALLPAICLENERRTGDITTVPWKEKDFSVLTQMVRRKERWVSPALAAFMDTAREVLGPTE